MPAFCTKLAVAWLAAASVLAAADPFVGTWKINLAKTKYDPGPPPKSLIRKYEPQGAGIKATTEGIDGEGKPILVWTVLTFDGKDCAIHGAQNYDTGTATRIDANTWKAVLKKSGKQVGTVTLAVSGGGKILTISGKAIDAKGRPYHNIAVYDKQ